jgi:hypothetical protein
MISRAVEICLRHAREKNWDKVYWAIDIHGTILKPNYKRNDISTEFYPFAIETLQLISKRTDIALILYTCSYPHEIEQYLALFADHSIQFDYVNQNPEIANGGYGYYQDKFYFNVLMDDKAGFDGEHDWKEVLMVIQKFEKIKSEINN